MKRTLLSFCFVSCVSILSYTQVTPNFNYTQTCYGNQTTLVASSSLQDTAISSWMWDLDGNGTYEMSGKTIISLFTLNDTITARLKITPTIGTADSITKNVIIDPLPNVNFMANNLCELKTATYISLSSVATGTITQWKWDFNSDGADDATGNTVTYVCGPAQTYTTQLTCVSDKGCSAFTQKITTVYPNPTAIFSTSNACVNANATFTNTSTVTNLDFYLWNFGDGNSNAITTNPGNATHSYSTAGTYSVDLIAVSQEGCRDTSVSSVTINPLPVISTNNSNTCLGGNVMLNASASNGTLPYSYQWFPGGPAVSPPITSTYTITVTDANGCTDMDMATVVVNPLPVVSITASDTVLHNNGNVTLIANGANNYSWNTGASSISITTDSTGTFMVTGTDVNGCTASASITILREGNSTTSVSVSGLILTPNNDGINDELIINNITAYLNCELNIFNMWNERVYSKEVDINNGWKGTNNNGDALGAGPYYYIIHCDGNEVLRGNINILK